MGRRSTRPVASAPQLTTARAAQVDIEGQLPEDVAAQFLTEIGVLAG